MKWSYGNESIERMYVDVVKARSQLDVLAQFYTPLYICQHL